MIFNAIIEKDENGYFASIPELEGCVSQGDTYEEVIKMKIGGSGFYFLIKNIL